MAQCALDYSYVRPRLNLDPVLVLEQARHPILEQLNTNFVYNDLNMEQEKYVLLTGPNASGKSIFLSQIGLIVLMAHVGCFVPARQAEIGLTTGIMTCLQTPHSTSAGLSSFCVELQQATRIVGQARSTDLVLVDEFGQGTHASGHSIDLDGIGLCCALLSHLCLDTRCRFIVATHYHGQGVNVECIQYKYVEHLPLNYLTMQCQFQDSLIYLYRVVPGMAESSMGVEVAKQLGFPSEFVERIQVLSDAIKQGEPIPLSQQNQAFLQVCQRICDAFAIGLDQGYDTLKSLEHCF